MASFYNIGDRKTNIIHTKLRRNLFEDAIHFFLDCPLYQHDRTSLFNYFNNIVPISIEYILFGCNEISEELNTLLFKLVPKFIRQTCRFSIVLSVFVLIIDFPI